MPVLYKCHHCGTKIRSNDGACPELCLNPQCGSRLASDRADDDIVMPFIRTSQATKNNDKLYRDMEKGSEVRAQIAADTLGVPVSEMSDMKVTNLNDRRDAEVAAMPVTNDVTRHMEQANRNGGNWGFQGSGGSQFGSEIASGAVTVNGKTVQGIEPRAGARTHQGLQRLFNK